MSDLPTSGWARWRWLVAALLAAAAIAIAVPLVGRVFWKGPAALPVAFIDDRSCAQCHQGEWREWSASHHAKAMQPANEKTVLGDFNDARFTHFGVASRFHKREGKFLVKTEGHDGKLAEFEVKYTFGVEPLQQYLVEFPGGRLQSLTIAWDTNQKRWFDLYPNEKIAPDDPLHWTGRYQNWNLMCAECHTTNLRKGYDLKTDSYTTTWTSINVGCQACHGPGEAHLKWASASQIGKAAMAGPTGLVIYFKTMGARSQVDACAKCHSRRTRLGAEERFGRPLVDEFRPELLRAELYYPDGQQLGEVYEYGSFRQSKMYQRGVRCTDCHNPHTAKLKARGNALCTQCHREQPDPRFPTLRAKEYDSPVHHFHKGGSAGAECVNCHMPAKNYMLVDARRDHSLRVPRPDLSVKLGTPDACTTCHRSRSSPWAAAAVRKWYGPTPQPGLHYAEVIAAGRVGARDAEPKLSALALDGEQPAIVRATALDLLRGYGPAGVGAMVAATKDEDPVVRATAVRGLDRLPPGERLAQTVPLLKDPIRAVRIEAARVLASVPLELFDKPQRAALEAALTEFTDAQMAMADMPLAHLNLGTLYASRDRRDLAEQSYRTALGMDPYFLPARMNLVTLLTEMGQHAGAEQLLREGMTLTPTRGELHYSLGLLLAEEKRLAEATDALGEAARLLPDRARVRYNYGLALQQRGRRDEAEAALLRAHELDREDPQILYALAVFYARERQFERALTYAQLLVERAPNEPGPRQLVERLRRALTTTERPR